MCERRSTPRARFPGIHRSKGVALGVQRLRIIDLETGDQPIYNEDRSVAVVLNGEIYNFRELRAELERRSLLLHPHGHRGDRPPLRGARARPRRGSERDVRVRGLGRAPASDSAGRDRVGKKPLFYAAGGLAQLRLGAARADGRPRDSGGDRPSSIDCYLAYGYIPAPWSIWRDVRKLRPAHTLVWENGRTRRSATGGSTTRGSAPRTAASWRRSCASASARPCGAG